MEYRKLSIECVGLYCIIGVLSVLAFIGIYGTNIINPSYISWLFDGGELSQHYLGWVAYRESSWHFPIGMVDKLAYPNLTSVIFTDSIPLFAVLFKVLSPVLPTNFQYMGLWGIMCFVLHGTLGSDPFTGNVIFLDKGVRPHDASPNIEKYFNLEIYNKGQEDEHLLACRERTDVIDREIALCGCFVLLLAKQMQHGGRLFQNGYLWVQDIK